MQKARCINCGKILGRDDLIWRIRTGYLYDAPLFAPCCSKECAEASKQKLSRREAEKAEIHAKEARSLAEQIPQSMPLDRIGEQA